MNNQFKITYPDGLIKDIQKYGNTIAKNIAIQVRDSLVHEYKYAVDRFYDAYTPKQYERKESLKKTCRGYYKNPHGTRFHGGVEIFPDKMGEHHDSNEYVLDISLEGIHGTTAIAVTPPWILQHVLNYRDAMFSFIDVNDGGIGSNAIAKAKNGSYSILKFT